MSDYEFKIWLVLGMVVANILWLGILAFIFHIDEKRNKWKYSLEGMREHAKREKK